MTVTFAEAVWQGVVILFGATLLGMVYKGLDRKLAAQMQGRIGPPLRKPLPTCQAPSHPDHLSI